MKITLRKAIALVFALSIYSTLSSQVQGVNYWTKYNSDSLWYDFYIVINNGSAAGNSTNAIQFNAQYSIVTATGDSIQLVKSYNPKYDANTPAPWVMSARVNSPQAQPQNDFYSIIPTLGGPNPPMYIDGLFPGDTVKLFSIKRIGQNSLCGKELRIFENGVDPNSSEPGMNYSDFSNGIGIGSTLQLYEGNSEQIAALSPTIQSAISTCTSGIEIDLTANSNGNQGPLSYSWTGPNGYNNTTEDVLISPAVLANNGTYKIIVTDSIGCKDSLEVEGLGKPDAGADQIVCAGTSHIIAGNPLSGTWSSFLGNPAGATRTHISQGVAQVLFSNTASGSYRFRYSIGATGTCNDTVKFTVNPIPNLTLVDNNGCVGDTLLNVLIANGTGSWTSSNPSVASVISLSGQSGSVICHTAGVVTFTFTRASSGCSNETSPFTVNPSPTIVGNDEVCIGSSITLNPNIGGTWSSSSPLIVSVTNSGIATGNSAGIATLVYTDSNGCNDNHEITVETFTGVNINESRICIGKNTTLVPETGGLWTSSDNTIATVNGNVVTSHNAGNVTFTFTSVSGCSGEVSLQVDSRPIVSITADSICVGLTSQAFPSSGGTWVSEDASVATISHNGLISGISAGTATFTYTSNVTLCSSLPTENLTVEPRPVIISPKNSILINENIQLAISGNNDGLWQNSNPNIASITSNGLVTGLAKGNTAIKYIEVSNGCESEAFELEVTGYKFILTGFCFTDINQNDIYDDGEDYPLSNCAITRSGSSTIYYTDTEGYFNFEVDSASNEVNYSINFGSWISNSITKTININKPVTYDFVGFKPSANAGTSASVTLSSTIPLCNTFAELNPIAFNESSTLLDGYLVIEYDDRTYFSETLPLPSGGSGNKLIWDFKDLAPGKIFSPNIKYFVPNEVTTPDSLHFTAWILDKNTGDTLNIFQFSEEIICNTTPPNIVAENWPNRQGDDNYTLNTETINYNITYRNKGNGTARRVTIETIIDEHLDANTLIIKESSFAYEASRIGNLLTIVFDSIELGSSREEEFGNLSYSFSIKNNTPDKTKVFSSVKITMDNDYEYTTEPILNTVVTILPCDLINDEINHIDDALSVTAAGNLYSWYDCNTNELLQSESNPFFLPSQNGNYYAIVEGDDCKTITDCYSYLGTSTDDNITSLIKIYPNPTNSIINIKGLENNEEVTLYNNIGERLIKCKCSTLDISDESNGIYFIEINGETRIQKTKFIKY